MTSRGIKNNNPGNLRKGADWKGLATNQIDPDFCVFTVPEFGIRAMAKILIKYQDAYGLNTVAKIINRWAPPNENDTEAYAEHIAKILGVTPNEPIDVHRSDTLVWLIKGIIKHENGDQPYADDVIEQGIKIAGV